MLRNINHFPLETILTVLPLHSETRGGGSSVVDGGREAYLRGSVTMRTAFKIPLFHTGVPNISLVTSSLSLCFHDLDTL